jgi:hypothetical protein
MEIFGNKSDVRIVVFSTNHTPTQGKLKKLFSSAYALIYKGHGHYHYQMQEIESVVKADAEIRGVAFGQGSYGANVVVLDSSASYSVFTILAHSQHILAYYQLNSGLYRRIASLTSAIEKVEWQLGACDTFVRSVTIMRDAIRPFGETDPVAESLDTDAFQSQWGQCGQEGILALKRQLAAELPNVLWRPSAPVPKSSTPSDDMTTDRSDLRKAA